MFIGIWHGHSMWGALGVREQLFPRWGWGGGGGWGFLSNFSPVQRRKTRSARGDEGGVGHIMLSCPKNILSTIIAIYWWVRINSWRILLTSKGKKVTARKSRDLAQKLSGDCPNTDTWEISGLQPPAPSPHPRLVRLWGVRIRTYFSSTWLSFFFFFFLSRIGCSCRNTYPVAKKNWPPSIIVNNYLSTTVSESAGIKQNQPEWRIFKIRATFGREFQTQSH